MWKQMGDHYKSKKVRKKIREVYKNKVLMDPKKNKRTFRRTLMITFSKNPSFKKQWSWILFKNYTKETKSIIRQLL